ncbi:MAG: amino acid ABC transporter ATP-binding protein [Halanaerobiaceae bacterium]
MLKIKNLQKSYHGDIVLNDINMKVESGEIIAIMGPSGCGKSTFIRCINRLVEPDTGEIYFKGLALHDLSAEKMGKVRQKIGFVFQHFNLIQRMTVKQNVALGLVKKGFSIDRAYSETRAVLRDVNLENLIDSRVTELSGGEKQRVGIARALVLKPDLMLLDEPTASLDPILIRDVLDILEEVAQKRDGTSMIIVTHEVAFARRVADRIFLMDQGDFIESNTPEKIFTEPCSWIGKKYKKLINYY